MLTPDGHPYLSLVKIPRISRSPRGTSVVSEEQEPSSSDEREWREWRARIWSHENEPSVRSSPPPPPPPSCSQQMTQRYYEDLFYQRHGYCYSVRGEGPRASDEESAGMRRSTIRRNYVPVCEPTGICVCCLSPHGNRTCERCWCKPLCRECLPPREHYCPLESGRALAWVVEDSVRDNKNCFVNKVYASVDKVSYQDSQTRKKISFNEAAMPCAL